MADSKNTKSSTFLPNFYRTDANKKFLQATVDQLIQPGTVKKINGYVGRQNAKATTGEDIFISEQTKNRQDYQLEPSLLIKDNLGNTTFFKDYSDYINQIDVFEGNTINHNRLNSEEFYSWDPHINWDKFVNFQQYYWLPYGPDVINVAGQQQDIESTFVVELERAADANAYIFSPKGSVGLVRNPSLKLYKGITYKFQFENPQDEFLIKTKRSEGKLDQYSSELLTRTVLENNIIEIKFTIPYNSPNFLYYVKDVDPDLGGTFEILSIDENTFVNIDEEILGKKTYTLANGIALSNGMKVNFIGKVTPEVYSTGLYYVEGVGDSIKLVNERDLEIVGQYTESQSVLFDNTPFDSLPFSDATAFAGTPDYIVINRSSMDKNPWSRYNRWFHKDVIEISAKINGNIPKIDQSARAVRPIIEFEADLKLFNFGTDAITDVDLVDTYTTDVFSKIEGQIGYNIDGIQLAQDQRILFTADTDILVKNKIFRVDFLSLNGVQKIHLVLEDTPATLDVVLIKKGKINQGSMFWYDGDSWVLGQQKTELNQSPLFDIVDANTNSVGDISVYEGSTFKGTKIFSYKISSGTADPNLGFALSYKNIENIGDIVFNFNLATDSFQYKDVVDIKVKHLNTGFLIKTINGKSTYLNGWQRSIVTAVQPAVRIYKNSKKTNNFPIDIFDDKNNLTDLIVRVYVNGIRLDQYPSKDATPAWELIDSTLYKVVRLQNDISENDVLTIKAFASQGINDKGYYEIPINLQNNPLNELISEFTLGEVIDHVNSIVENIPNFIGSNPGVSNIRDLGNVTKFGTKFVQHSGPMSLSLYHITSESNNIVRAIEKSKEDYNKFKRNFIAVAEVLGIDADPARQVDLILQKINKDKPNTFPYYFSDMVPYGSCIRNDFTVLDYRIKTYPLTNVFSLDKLSNNAVLVYRTTTDNLTTQLLYEIDYIFNEQGFVEIISTIETDDTLTICEYENTNGCFVPATPTKLGLWPKYEPKLYVDTTLLTPKTLIQGHDGSLVLAYNDYRDDLVLELEKRIYNNIKVKYDTSIFDIHDIIPGYNRKNDYTLNEFNNVLAPQFYKWTSLIEKDFSKPLNYDRSNILTYNHRGLIAPDNRETPGFWRGVYRWLLDTDRPNICPWEMLGFFEQPSWWEEVYGPAPYTKDNLILWNDLAEGYIREPGKLITQSTKYQRQFLKTSIPVDEDGNVVGPIECGLANGVLTQLISSDYVFGDVGPVESAWRRSSFYPFSIIITAMLLKPAKTFGLLLDRSRIKRNLAGQIVYTDTEVVIAPKDVILPSIYSSTSVAYTAGIINYIVDYILSDNLKSYKTYKYDLENVNANLSYRISGFTSKEKFQLLLDSKTPLSAGSVFVPQEDYDVILNMSSSVKKITYSGVIISKFDDGFEIKGYSRTRPYFKYYQWIRPGTSVNVGGISESFLVWTPGEQYKNGSIVKYDGNYYRVKITHIAENRINLEFCEALPSLPYIGGQTANIRVDWNRKEELILPYGLIIRDVQEVVDFLLGYGEYLKDQGFIFDEFNTELGVVTNWETSAKEFLFWLTQNWSTGEEKWQDWLPTLTIPYDTIVKYNGEYYKSLQLVNPSPVFQEEEFVKLDGLSTVGSSVLSLSPSATKLTFTTPLSVVDDIRNPFNGYEIYSVTGQPIAPNFINYYRENNAVSYSPDGEAGIYCASFYLKQQEQVVVLNNTTMFNDTIYHPASGYRQERIKVSGYRTSTWDGSFNAPGFIFDRSLIQEWTPWTDYNLGDIVKYKEFYYSSKSFIPGTENFDQISWNKLDSQPSAKLLPNWTYKSTQFEDFYSLDSDNFDADQQKVAQHLIGYQKRQYLSNIIKDDVSEYKFYQGMITEKGTKNVLNKLFDVLSSQDNESLEFYEEWAVRTANYGAANAFDTIEFVLDESLFKTNPQGFELENIASNKSDYIIRQGFNDVYLKPVGYNSTPWPVKSTLNPYLRSPGFVKISDVKLILKTLDDILATTDWNAVDTYPVNSTVNYNGNSFVANVKNKGSIPSITSPEWRLLSPSDFSNGDYIWCGFEKNSWDVYRLINSDINIISIESNETNVTFTLDTLVTEIAVGQVIGILDSVLKGFYKVTDILLDTFTIDARTAVNVSGIEPSSVLVFEFTSHRLESINDLGDIPEVVDGELVWTDNSGDGKWATWEYHSAYLTSEIVNTLPKQIEISSVLTTVNYGRQVLINDKNSISAISTSQGDIIVYDKVGPSAPWIQRQTISAPFISKNDGLSNPTPDTYTGDILAISSDGKWLVSGVPTANAVCTRLLGNWNGSSSYVSGDIVYSNNVYYAARSAVPAGTTPSANPIYWREVFYVPTDISGENSTLLNQGVISIYEKDSNNIYSLIDSIISPSPSSNEKFGSTVVFSGNRLFVSAVGYASNVGRVYQYDYLDRVITTAYYNPVGSSETTVKVSTTLKIEVGMKVVGQGFDSHTVVDVVDETTIIVNKNPTSDPSGSIQFVVSEWGYTGKFDLPVASTTSDKFGYALAVSKDLSTLIVSSINNVNAGKVFVYTNDTGTYTLAQTLISTDGSRFGESITVSNTGEFLAISSIRYDGLKIDQGLVTVYTKVDGIYVTSTSSQNAPYNLINKVPEINQYFGSKIFFMNDYKTLVVYSINADTYVQDTFDIYTTTFDTFTYTDDFGVEQTSSFVNDPESSLSDRPTTFDNQLTTFVSKKVDSGRVDIYDQYDTKWVFSESLGTDISEFDNFGSGISVGSNHILVGALTAKDDIIRSGRVYEYYKADNVYSWTKVHLAGEYVDNSKIKRAFLYNKTTNEILRYIDVLDAQQGKIPGPADQEIKFKTFYDPAIYSVGNENVRVDDGMAWTTSQIGALWWDLRSTKFIESNSTDIVYKNANWNTLFPGASVDILEWVETTLLPEDWDALADTEEGLSDGISGTSLYGNTAYSIVKKYDNTSKSYKETYYYWVKNKKTVPDVWSRSISAVDISNLIENPRGEGYVYVGFSGNNSFSLINVEPLLQNRDIVLSVDYWKVDNLSQNIHREWKLINNDVRAELPKAIEEKWFDSLCGKDSSDRLVPDMNLPLKLRYGIENRPRQGMFINRFEALKQLIEQTNQLLSKHQIAEQKDLTGLETYDAEPNSVFGLYDVVLDTDLELRFAGIGTFSAPVLTPIIKNGKLISVTIEKSGSGFGKLKPKEYDEYGNAIEWAGPEALIIGVGIGAEIKTTINVNGQIIRVDVIESGYGYLDSTIISVRSFSALVHSDTQLAGGWAIYSYDLTSKIWSRIQSQAYDTRNYWTYVDWYATGYNQFTAASYSVDTFAELTNLETSIGDIVKIRTTSSNRWLLLEKYDNSTSVDWTRSYKTVGLEKGTIQFSSTIYKYTGSIYGYDGSLYDVGGFDNSASLEIRYILKSLRDNILIDDLRNEYLNLFFNSIRYVLSEQLYVDWIFKTSFVKARHNVGQLTQKVTYNNDNLSNFEEYVAEVKPYRTQIREYVSSYEKLDTSNSAITDFDLPALYENNKLYPITAYVIDEKIVSDDRALLDYPWKFWYDNNGYEVLELRVIDGGSKYLSPPMITIESSSGEGATARAYISNGKVSRVLLSTPGKGYLSAPKVIVNGSIADGGTPAKVVAIIGKGLVRSNLIKMKFDRITNTYFINEISQRETFVGTGTKLQFSLTWAPDIRIGTSTVVIDGVDALRDDYTLAIVKTTTRGYTSYSGKITFDSPPAVGASISVTYLKDWSLLNAADRIQYYYNPVSGELGKDLSQLMTGIDYGGVVVSGMNFEVSAGWDSVPYYTGKWDSYDETFDDYIVVVAANTHEFTLPYIPDLGEEINVYYSTVKTFVTDITLENSTSTTFYFDPEIVYPPKVVVTKTTSTNSINTAGNYIVNLVSTSGVKIGDLISTSLVIENAFGYGTKVIEINGNTVTLDQILFVQIPSGTTIVFTRELIDPTDCTINQNGTVFLVEELEIGSRITVSSSLTPVRLDDPNYGGVDPIDNQDAIMLPYIGNNSSSTIEIPETFTVYNGDKFIFRKNTSDGAFKPQESDYDTALSGGDLGYNTAVGIAAEDIIVDGDGFVTPVTSPAPEEVVPGQVVDSVAIKVFDRPTSGSANIRVDNYIGDGITTEFNISQRPNNPEAVIVKLVNGIVIDNVNTTKTTIVTVDEDYTIDYNGKKVIFNVAPVQDAVVSITSFGFSGVDILDIDEITSDGVTFEYITNAPWVDNFVPLVYVNGETVVQPEIEFFKTEQNYSSPNRIAIRFNVTPIENSLINYLIVNGSTQTFSITKTERLPATGVLEYNLTNLSGTHLPIESNMIVRVDDKILKAPLNSYYTIKNNRLNYKLDVTKFAPYSVSANDISVIADQNLLIQNVDYVVDTKGINIKLSKIVYDTYVNKSLVICVTAGQEYTYLPTYVPKITFNKEYNDDEIIEVITSYNHDVLDIQRTGLTISSTTTLTPNTLEYYNYLKISTGVIQLDRSVIDDNYVWVVKNGSLLTPSIDFKLNPSRTSVTLSQKPTEDDEFTLITFSSNILTNGIAYMQFKDMLNRVHYKRLSLVKQGQLADDLMYNDIVIKVEVGIELETPNPAQNRPGVVEIRGERIEFFTIDTEEYTDVDGTRDVHVLGQLRRGTLGTGTPKIHKKGSKVQEIGPSETIPYSDTNIIENYISNGVSNTVEISFVPSRATKPNTSVYKTERTNESVDWVYVDTTFESTIPEGYGQTDEIEVFVGGNNRLKKKPYTVHNTQIHPESPEGDVQFDAEFSVDGVSNEVRLTNVLEFGTQITVVKRTGNDWDSFNNIQYSNTRIAEFLKATPGIWYTAIDKYESKSTLTSTFDSVGGTYDDTGITFDQG